MNSSVSSTVSYGRSGVVDSRKIESSCVSLFFRSSLFIILLCWDISSRVYKKQDQFFYFLWPGAGVAIFVPSFPHPNIRNFKGNSNILL